MRPIGEYKSLTSTASIQLKLSECCWGEIKMKTFSINFEEPAIYLSDIVKPLILT